MAALDDYLTDICQTSPPRGTGAYSELLTHLLQDSLDHQASHISLHCTSTDLVARYRIGSQLSVRCMLPREHWDALVKTIKIQCRMDILESRRPQYARITVATAAGKRIVDVSVVYSSRGPSVVFAWESQELKCRTLDEVGLLPDQRVQVSQWLERRVGLIVLGASSFSGRRTLGHAALMAIRDQGKQVVSLEWEVDRVLTGIQQYDFAASPKRTQVQWIQEALHKRPDALFVEHPGNTDTIGYVVGAARDRCLVIAAMGRRFEYLIDYLERPLGISRETSTETLLGVVEQQLIPTLCARCASAYQPTKAELRELRIRTDNPQRIDFAKGNGCEECRYSGQGGRIGVHEVAEMAPALREMFLQRSPADAVRRQLLDGGMTTFYQSAIYKLVARQISAATAVACRRYSNEPNAWFEVDPDTARVERSA